MHSEVLSLGGPAGGGLAIPLTWVHTLVLGSGAAGLNAAVQLRANGIADVLIVTEGLNEGTSFNAGSDKQTYYKLAVCGDEADSPRALADVLYAGGGMHGDIALVEASLSARAFFHLVQLGVRFPTDRFGQYVGYRTDHAPQQRATSAGPYTSRDMCRALGERVAELGIPVREGRSAVQLLTVDTAMGLRAAGALAITEDGRWEVYAAENVVFAVGGAGGLYRDSVYPEGANGAIGLALAAGARAQNLPEAQFGLASTRARWNMSGSYMQVVPRVISTAADGASGEREFLLEPFGGPAELHSAVFLKGYQWPFDVRRVGGGSSLIDLLVHVEREVRGRRVFLDFRCNPSGFVHDRLIPEARHYLQRSDALGATPLERLRAMNPAAIEVYAAQGIDLAREPVEVSVCAQHSNGGLAGDLWWQSTNMGHLFPVGEVNGSHGVYRPGGSALNAGQVGGYRVAEVIARRYRGWTLPSDDVRRAARAGLLQRIDWLERSRGAPRSWQAQRAALQARMSEVGGYVRSLAQAESAVPEAWAQYHRLEREGCAYASIEESVEALRTRHLCFAHAVYLEAIRYALWSGVGSRGSALVVHPEGIQIHPALGEAWRMQPEDGAFRGRVLESIAEPDGHVEHRWVPCRPVPSTQSWFETEWARFQRGETE